MAVKNIYRTACISSASENTANGSGDISDLLTLAPGASVIYTAECLIDTAATGILVNSASIASAANDPNAGNETAEDVSEIAIAGDFVFSDGFEPVSAVCEQ